LGWLRRHQLVVLLIVLVTLTWGALWVVYDYRSPVSQFLRGVGTVQIEGWSAYDLDAQCVRLEDAVGTPAATAETAGQVASSAFPSGYVRQILLVSFRDTCTGAAPRLAWAVAIAWPVATRVPSPSGGPPRAIVLVDAVTGTFIVSHAEGKPQAT
jgi:hypothetical protein